MWRQNSQNILEKEKQKVGRLRLPNFKTLKSYGNQDKVVLAQGETNKSMEYINSN